MSHPRNPNVVNFIEEGPHLHIDCTWPECRHEVLLNAQQAAKLFGPKWKLADIRPRLKCSKCGATAREKRVVAYPSSFDDAIARHRFRLQKEIDQYGAPQTAPLLLPGLGHVYPEDLGLQVKEEGGGPRR